MADASADIAARQEAAIETVQGSEHVALIAAEGAQAASRVVAAMRARLGSSVTVEDLAAAWRAGVVAADGATLSGLIGVVRGDVATFIHAGDIVVHAIGQGEVRRLVRPHSRLADDCSFRVRTRAIGLSGASSRAELSELRLDRVQSLFVSTASVWHTLGESLADELLSTRSAADIVERSTRIGVLPVLARVPLACARIVLPSTGRGARPAPVTIAAQRSARRAVRSVLHREVSSRAAVIVARRGAGKTTVLEHVARVGLPDRTASVLTATQLRRELKAGTLAGFVVSDRLVDAIGSDAALALSLCEALGSGDLSLVTSATPEELARLAGEHKRLAAQLTPIELGAPTDAETLEVLSTWAPRFAERHHVTIEPDVLPLAVQLTRRFTLARAQPEAALFALEHACLRAGHTGVVTSTLTGRGGGTVDRAAVRAAIADLQGIAVELVDDNDAARAPHLFERLTGRLHGQHRALEQICNAVHRGVDRHRGTTRPLASLLLLGPTGTGKSETAHVLAESWFADRRAVTTIDASEYREPSSVYRLTGAPPGHVGYGEPSPFAAALAKNPHRVVLFDELEKSCTELQLLLLQILDNARLTTSTGEVLDFSNAIVVMTSNLESEDARVGFSKSQSDDDDDARRRKLSKALRPELVARIDEVVAFAPLTREAALAIALGHFVRCSNALVAANRLRFAQLPALRQRVLDELRTLDLAGGARAVLRAVERILGSDRQASAAGPLVVLYPYHDGGRERLAAGLLLELRSAADRDVAIERLLTHPASGSLLYIAHDATRVIALAGDEAAATELGHAVGSFGTTRTAVGRARSDVSGRPVGELLERLLA